LLLTLTEATRCAAGARPNYPMEAAPHMPTLLHIDSSCTPQETSVSRQLTADFAAQWTSAHGDGNYRYRDLAADPISFVGAGFPALGHRLEREGTHPHHQVVNHVITEQERTEWQITLPLIQEVIEADTILLGVPMYNFSIPAAVKAWIDRVTFPGVYIDQTSGAQLLANTQVVIVCSRGGAYGPGTPRFACDFQEPYLRAWFTEDLGVREDNIHFIHAEMTRAQDVPKLYDFRKLGKQSLAAAQDRIKLLAAGELPHDASSPAES
jgi:FMN-dependent NADH-azoreductase